MSNFVEREGILITEKGTVHIRHEGKLLKILDAKEIHPKKKGGRVVFWEVEFEGGVKAKNVSNITMSAALARRAMECSIEVIEAPYDAS